MAARTLNLILPKYFMGVTLILFDIPWWHWFAKWVWFDEN
jgi:hypothetical protein